jgi:hypothetical protein
VIDKVELRLPARTQFSGEFGQLYRDIHHDPKFNPFRESRYYASVGDLRHFGHDVILHLSCLRDKEGNHKLELIDTGNMKYADMAREVQSIFDVDTRRLSLMRVDLAADVRGVPVGWFADHVRARWKRFVCDIGETEYARMGRQRIETLYLGKRPNCFRIYDKIAEYKHQYARLTRRASDAAELPTFESAYGYPETGITLTRVERQIGASRVPAQIDTFGKLKRSASFNPFDRLDFLSSGEREPAVDKYGLQRYGFGMWLRHEIEDNGAHRVRAFINAHSPGHASRYFSEYQDFLPVEAGIDGQRLFQIYQESVSRQLED